MRLIDEISRAPFLGALFGVLRQTRRMRQLAIVLAYASTCGVATAQPVRPVLPPAGPWQLHLLDYGCRMTRSFGGGDDAASMEFSRGLNATSVTVSVFDRKFKARPGQAKLDFRFEKTGVSWKRRVVFGQSSEKKGGIIVWREEVAELDRQTSLSQNLAFSLANGPWLRLSIPDISYALIELRMCHDRMMAQWGVDMNALRKLKTQAEPILFPTWLSQYDRPNDFVFGARGGGTTYMVLDVDNAGGTSNCRTIFPSGIDALDLHSCRVAKARARFRPAIGADGAAADGQFFMGLTWYKVSRESNLDKTAGVYGFIP